MVYSGKGIKKLIKTGKMAITPKSEIKEASIKIHFSTSFTIKPKELLITKTTEHITLADDLAALYDGYTHLARRGIITHLGSMFVDPGTNGPITLEVFNASDGEIKIEQNERAGHLVILKVID
jgi:dCTP deaminase